MNVEKEISIKKHRKQHKLRVQGHETQLHMTQVFKSFVLSLNSHLNRPDLASYRYLFAASPAILLNSSFLETPQDRQTQHFVPSIRTSRQTGMCSSSPPRPGYKPQKCCESQLAKDIRTASWVYNPPRLELSVKSLIKCRNVPTKCLVPLGIDKSINFKLQPHPRTSFH